MRFNSQVIVMIIIRIEITMTIVATVTIDVERMHVVRMYRAIYKKNEDRKWRKIIVLLRYRQETLHFLGALYLL